MDYRDIFKKTLLNGVKLFGVDRAIGYTLLARVVGIVAMPITLIFIAGFLTPEEQGYYYTFGSLLGLTMFFDLGLTNVLLLFASHEKAHLEWGPKGVLTGDVQAKARLVSLMRLGMKWFGAAAVLIVIVLYPVGLFFFGSQDHSGIVAWRSPWLMAVIVTAVSTFIAPVFAILEGCGRVKELRFLGFIKPLICNPVLWLVLAFGGGLFAGPAFWGCAMVVGMFWLIWTHSHFLSDFFTSKRSGDSLPWREIWPLQWRIALGWMSGYLAFQLFNPMLFAFHGPVVAGKMGMSLNLSLAVYGVGLSWVGTKVPRMGGLWARKEYRELNSLFFSSIWRSVAVAVAGGCAILLGLFFLRHTEHPYAERLLDPLPFAMLLAVQSLNVIIMSESFCLRANKQDPLVWLSVLYGILVMVSNLVLGSRFGALGMTSGYLACSLFICLTSTVVYMRYKSRWQKEDL
ncbi:MAG: hypothetical protein KAH23_06400 [Kiritimatiellae bacterium]|nr:hypothetical protein [Kiritimatiellia bacterium]